jgi:DMSO/TMAO reductase YedYZ molybdopterin-dependent catalytic subunit
LAGLFGAGIALLADGALHLVAPAVPFAPVAVGQAVIRAAPGAVDAFFINRLQHLARPMAVIGAIVGFVVLAVALGMAVGPVSRRLGGRVFLASSFLSAPLYAFAVATYRRESGSVPLALYAVALLAVFAPAVWASARAFKRMTVPVEPGSPDPLRRTVLAAVGMGGVGVLLGWGAAGRLFRRPNPGRLRLHARDVTPAKTPPPRVADRGFARVPGLSPEITPNERFYIVNEELVYPDIDPDTWSLRVHGTVARPFALRYRELLSMPAVEQFQTLECISNKVGGRLISTARWTGIPLHHLLERAGVRGGSVEVVSRSVDGYADSIPLADAARPTTLIAFGMNRMVLPREHGFPARLLVPGYYGMKQPKWLGEIEVVNRPFQGYWEQRGWIKDAVVKTMSRIDTPNPGASVGRDLVVAGVAFAGDRGISRVQVSADGGRTWGDAQLETRLSAFTWRRWRIGVRIPGSSQADLLVRATDGSGRVQTSAVTPPEYSGSTGYHEVVVEPQD